MRPGLFDRGTAAGGRPGWLGSGRRFQPGHARPRGAAHPFATAHFDPDSYGVAIIPTIASFVAGRRGLSGDDASAWAAELTELGERDEFYFASLQFCFLGTRPS